MKHPRLVQRILAVRVEHERNASAAGLARSKGRFITSQLLDDLHIDPQRAVMAENFPRTGIFVRAKDQGGNIRALILRY